MSHFDLIKLSISKVSIVEFYCLDLKNNQIICLHTPKHLRSKEGRSSLWVSCRLSQHGLSRVTLDLFILLFIWSFEDLNIHTHNMSPGRMDERKKKEIEWQLCQILSLSSKKPNKLCTGFRLSCVWLSVKHSVAASCDLSPPSRTLCFSILTL